MAEKEYIERGALIENIKRVYCADCNSYNGVRCRACGTGDALDMIEDAPSADMVEVVRCKDCRYWDGEGRCETPTNGITRDFTNHYDFCSYGKRKESNDYD